MPTRELRLSSRLPRRAALQIGAGLFGLDLPRWLQASEQTSIPSSSGSNRDMSCIFLFLAGGPSQFETFDPKPEAPVGIRGEWDAMQTNVPGTFICEKLPLMARRMDKVAVIRSWQGKNGGHDTGSQHVTSGFLPAARGGQYFPNFGCLISALQGNKVPGMPAHFGLPVAARYTNPPRVRRLQHQRGSERSRYEGKQTRPLTGSIRGPQVDAGPTRQSQSALGTEPTTV